MLNLLTRFKASAPVPQPDHYQSGQYADRIAAPDISSDDGPYQVISYARQIMGVLQDLIETRQPITLIARGQNAQFMTRITAADLDTGQVLVKQLTNEHHHAALMMDGHINLSAQHEGTPVLFTLDILGTTELDGLPCYRLQCPDWMLRVQMRQSVRVRLPKHLHAILSGASPTLPTIDARVHDLSEGGIGFVVPQRIADHLTVGTLLSTIELHASALDLTNLKLIIRHRSPLDEQTVLIGATIETASEADRRSLRCFILAHQHTSSSRE